MAVTECIFVPVHKKRMSAASVTADWVYGTRGQNGISVVYSVFRSTWPVPVVSRGTECDTSLSSKNWRVGHLLAECLRRRSNVQQECDCQGVLVLHGLRPRLPICYLGLITLGFNKDNAASVSWVGSWSMLIHGVQVFITQRTRTLGVPRYGMQPIHPHQSSKPWEFDHWNLNNAPLPTLFHRHNLWHITY